MPARDTTDAILAALRDNVARVSDQLEALVIDATNIVDIAVRQQASLTDHSLNELAKLGYPYRLGEGGSFSSERKRPSRRFVGPMPAYWNVKLSRKARQAREIFGLGHSLQYVHIQSGELQKSIESSTFRTEDVIMGRVGIADDAPPYVLWVLTGTRRMIPRNFMMNALKAVGPRVRTFIRNGLQGIAKDL